MAIKAIPFTTDPVNGLKQNLSGERASPCTVSPRGGAGGPRDPSLWVTVVTPGLWILWGQAMPNEVLF